MITVAWDVDDVLNELTSRWLTEAWLPAHRNSLARYEGLTENPPYAVLGVSRDEYLESLDAFRHDERCTRQAARPEVLAWFGREGDKAFHIALTAVPVHAADLSAAWVLRTFGRWVRCYGLVPSPRPGDPTSALRSKGEWLEWFGGVDVLVDDSEQNVTEASEMGIAGVVFPQPWNSAASRSVADTLAEVTALVEAGVDARGARA